MSGPIVPPLQVTEVDGSPDGRPITKIVVSNGDLSISGRTATIDTSGSATTPGGSDTEVQYNDGGAFGGDAGMTYNKTTNVLTVADGVVTANLDVGNLGANAIRATDLNGNVYVLPEGTGNFTIQGDNNAGGTVSDISVLLIKAATTDEATIQIQDNGANDVTTLKSLSGGDFQIKNLSDTSDVDVVVTGTGQLEVQNATTDSDSVISIMGNGTGDAKLDLQNASKRVWVLCDENKKLKIQGGSGGDTFIFDVSSATGSLTWPDGTSQSTAASGGAATYGYVTVDPTIPTDGGTRTYSQSVPASAPYWGNDTAGTGGYAWDEPFFWPFIAAHTGDVDSLSVDVATAGAATEWYVGIYDVDSDGIPDNLLGKAIMDMSSTGVVTQTTLSSTISLTKGEMYYWSYVKKTGVTAQTWRAASPPAFGLSSDSSGPADIGTCFYYDDATNDLPAAPTPANFEQAARTDPTMGAIAW